MNLKVLKFLMVGAFLAFAACAFFMSGGDKIEAQSKEAVRKKAEILEKVADYKKWEQINKVDKENKTDVISIADSSALG